MKHPMMKDFDPHNPTCPRCKEKLTNRVDKLEFELMPANFHVDVYTCQCGALVSVVVPNDPTRN